MFTLKNILASAALASCALVAQAQVTTDVKYNLALSDSVFNGGFRSGQPCNFDTSTAGNRYRTITIRVTAAGTYNFFDEGYDLETFYKDGTLGVYSGAFNPASPSSTCVGTVDDDQDLNLDPGTYTLVLSSYNGPDVDPEESDIPGQFWYKINGPASVVLPTPTVAAVPTLAEWSLMLLSLGAAGLGMRRLRRKG